MKNDTILLVSKIARDLAEYHYVTGGKGITSKGRFADMLRDAYKRGACCKPVDPYFSLDKKVKEFAWKTYVSHFYMFVHAEKLAKEWG